MPNKKKIVLIGCPIDVVKPKPHRSQPMIIDTIENKTLFLLVIG